MDIYIPMFIMALFTIAKLWNHPRCPPTDEWIEKCGTHTQRSFTQPLRRMKSAGNRTADHHIKSNKSFPQSQVSHAFSHLCKPGEKQNRKTMSCQ
jgi:hypothetical protein